MRFQNVVVVMLCGTIPLVWGMSTRGDIQVMNSSLCVEHTLCKDNCLTTSMTDATCIGPGKNGLRCNFMVCDSVGKFQTCQLEAQLDSHYCEFAPDPVSIVCEDCSVIPCSCQINNINGSDRDLCGFMAGFCSGSCFDDGGGPQVNVTFLKLCQHPTGENSD